MTAWFSAHSHTGLSLSPPVHPHSGDPAHFLSERPGLCGITAHCVAAWEAGVLHGHPQNSPERPCGAVCGQEPQADAAEVSEPAMVPPTAT